MKCNKHNYLFIYKFFIAFLPCENQGVTAAFPPSSYVNTTPITRHCAVMYILKGLPVLGACKTGGEDKYSFIFSKASF
jgi:hypothetical protein